MLILSSIILFCCAVAIGLMHVILGVRKKKGSLLLAMLHVAFAVAGLSALWLHISDAETVKLFNVAMLLFVLALFGGFVLLALRISKREFKSAPPMFFVSLHAFLGLFALMLLVVGYLKY